MFLSAVFGVHAFLRDGPDRHVAWRHTRACRLHEAAAAVISESGVILPDQQFMHVLFVVQEMRSGMSALLCL